MNCLSLFTEKSERHYATWGIKRESTDAVCYSQQYLIYAVTAAFVVMKVWGVRDSGSSAVPDAGTGRLDPELTGVLAVLHDDPAAGTVKLYTG
ncbi:MAG: hypothetical protein ACLVGL_03070 [Waltera sp.]